MTDTDADMLFLKAIQTTPPKYIPSEAATLNVTSGSKKIETEHIQSKQGESNKINLDGTLSLCMPLGSASPSTISKHKLFVTPSFAAGMESYCCYAIGQGGSICLTQDCKTQYKGENWR